MLTCKKGFQISVIVTTYKTKNSGDDYIREFNWAVTCAQILFGMPCMLKRERKNKRNAGFLVVTRLDWVFFFLFFPFSLIFFSPKLCWVGFGWAMSKLKRCWQIKD